VSEPIQSVLILGAGINGSALARELALNGLNVVVVEERDVAAGTTAYSSRLIHGGLRYLEYGEFDLVRESLAERTRWLRLAPHYVRPLRLFIPIRNRSGGLWTAAKRFLRFGSRPSDKPEHRGLWAIRMGLWLYDLYARDPSLPRRRLYAAHSPEAVSVDRKKFRWLYSFSDAQVKYPERFTLALLEDARRIAVQTGRSFDLFTYHRAVRDGRQIRIVPVGRAGETTTTITPAAIINATGPWVDRTLAALDLSSPRLIGGVKGSHFITTHAGLRERLAGRAIYGEAHDGRPIFVLPMGTATLIGTTEVPLDADPADAVASPEELDYLLNAVNEMFEDLRIQPADIEMHYSGVRPLPRAGSTKLGAVTRRHWLEPCESAPEPCYSLVGGKLTTCRSLAQEGAATILARLGLGPTADSRERPLPGGENYPADAAALESEWRRLAVRFSLPQAAIEAVWSLVGTRTESTLAEAILAEPTARELETVASAGSALLAGTNVPKRFVQWSLRHEWAATLDDLIERRLMLLYQPDLSRECLRELARMLFDAGKLPIEQADAAVAATERRLAIHFGKTIRT
jgi:glycerol-3-phosphate dehydrogenase